ncbi:uncharacterized protein METZ01_LOCUS243354, partial [marine metagenome]
GADPGSARYELFQPIAPCLDPDCHRRRHRYDCRGHGTDHSDQGSVWHYRGRRNPGGGAEL